jgi:hypothetical protein
MGAVTVDLSRAADTLLLESRLQAIPAWAMSRGVFFNLIDDELKRRGFRDHLSWRPSNGGPRRAYKLYPVRELVSAWAVAGALIHEDARQGMRQLAGGGSRYFAASLVGSAFRRFLRPDPATALLWLERHREHLCNYGRWRVEIRRAGHVVLHMFDEYFWIDGFQQGGCEGFLAACGVQGEVNVELDGPFQGRLDIRWLLST